MLKREYIMYQEQTLLNVETHGQGLYDITDVVHNWVQSTSMETGLLTMFIQHTSASLIIQENADPDVQLDLQAAMGRLAPHDPRLYVHRDEGPDDMPAHIKSTLVGSSISIPISNHRLNLGVWQGIYLCEFRNHAGKRQLVATIYS